MSEEVPGPIHIQHMPAGVIPAPLHPREEDRITLLHEYRILDTPHDPVLNLLTELAASICGTPMAAIALVNRNRQWFKSAHGFDGRETGRDVAFSAWSVLDGAHSLVIPDTLLDSRFSTHPGVLGDPFIRFYAGAPLSGGGPLSIGSFCVMDRTPRDPSSEQIAMLEKLADVTMQIFEGYRTEDHLTQLIELEKEIYTRLLPSASRLVPEAETFDEALSNLVTHLDPKLGWLSARIRNIQTGTSTGTYYNPSLPRDPLLQEIWNEIDSKPGDTITQIALGEYISQAPLRSEFTHLKVPVRVRNRLVAVMEFLYHDHLFTGRRTRDVFDMMASNISLVAERELADIELRQRASRDPLTNVANRYVIMKELESAIANADSVSPDAALLYIDVDGFKEVNDNFGHETGDRLLVEIARRLDELCRQNDLLGRLSGDEFVLLARHLDTKEGLNKLLKRVQRGLSTSFMLGELELKITLSIGCVVISDADITTSELLRRAEAAMYLVKNGTRKGICVADEEVIRDLKNRRKLERTVLSALDKNNLFLVIQPIIELSDGSISGAEILLRLRREDGSIMVAGDFIETMGHIRSPSTLDELVIAESLRSLNSCAKPLLGIKDFHLSVNMTPAILSSTGYSWLFLSQLENAGIPPSTFTIELTERLLPDNFETLRENLSMLRGAGVRIAIDDFESGYSNLRNLAGLPIDIVKIDRSFLAGIRNGDTMKNAILSSIVGTARNLSYTVIGEGVEQQEEADHLQSLGCRYAQGHLYGRPIPVEDFVRTLQPPKSDGNRNTTFVPFP